MNNKFTLNANGIKKDAEMIVKFNLENKDYLIYCTDENESNKQVFALNNSSLKEQCPPLRLTFCLRLQSART